MIMRRKQQQVVLKVAEPQQDRRVRFDDSKNQLFEIDSVINIEEGIIEKLWYQPWERNEHKQAIKRDAQEWRKTGLGLLLQDTFADPNPKKSQSCLNAFVLLADADYVRGIERHLSQRHYEQRTERKVNFVDDVLEQAHYLNTLRDLTDDERREKLAEFSSLQSKCAEVFARRLGRADATAAKRGEDPAAAAKLVSKLFRHEMRRTRSVEHPAPESMVMATVESKRLERRSSFSFLKR